MNTFLFLLLPGLGLLIILVGLSYPSRSYSSRRGSSLGGQVCPYCSAPLNGKVLVGSIQEQRALQNRCPRCGKTMPHNVRIQIKR